MLIPTYNIVELDFIVIQYTAFFLATWFVRISWLFNILFFYITFLAVLNSNLRFSSF